MRLVFVFVFDASTVQWDVDESPPCGDATYREPNGSGYGCAAIGTVTVKVLDCGMLFKNMLQQHCVCAETPK